MAAPRALTIGWAGKTTASTPVHFLTVFWMRACSSTASSVARLLVHKLIPNVSPNMTGPHDVAVAQFDYSALDRANQAVRLRLNSTVVGVRETKEDQVEVDYVQFGSAQRVTAKHCILACYNALIPHLCPEMSDEQKEGLSYGEKTPFVYANVQLKTAVLGHSWALHFSNARSIHSSG